LPEAMPPVTTMASETGGGDSSVFTSREGE